MGNGDGSKKIATSGSAALAEEEEEEVELNLGLSLGGRFGVDRSSSRLKRSSSIASCLPAVRDDSDDPGTGLVRTSSLPLEAEEEWRKRRQLQSLRRMEAKRRRSEKRRNLRGEKGGSVSGERFEREGQLGAVKSSSMESQGGSDWVLTIGKGSYLGKASNVLAELKGGSSSAGLEMEGSSREALQGGAISGGGRESTSMNPSSSRTHPAEDMPCVFTVGDGPNGRRVDGILYRYGKGEEVQIMCVCHGSFHSPAEFVKHAGGSDVDHPLKHIVINRNASPLL